ncbi:double-strand break repair helicase AddA [Rhizobium lentis]|uniref:double-strand break repair helicase AddA n=1 Tax=Rhizobium lentis TaxID=1138194 RepID=UPI001C831EC1|nr:double-strand break repair helicase AddA [Rhizobium lentis]MBX4958493.1 double-strand break repair helicase AddA [Rhizobium lentis]MBX4988499.1 double-strand break repair helicase AddA [Rhizobium lentis]MBX5006948.1 double-strand break repair helicase AddA [Rhizobium lentis]MBX5031544.1 double-strand break repair helicase AddA [Rhizobium lentis]MBX5037743.1 double-strand break repair helicase AddA [Rhizobium lentis]
MSNETALPSDDDPGAWIGWTTIQQAIASDPERSAWVSANAGSGKTHVLTQRVIRLLLAGARPSAILCLTYTKAAASEMSNRVFERLADWVVLDDADLSRRIMQIEGAAPDALKLAEARRLFAKALETPGGLKIQTIHAFCEALLHQFPLEANVAGHFSVLDDRAAAALLSDARRALLTATAPEEGSALAEAFAYVLDLGDESGLENLLADIVANRNAIRRFTAAAERRGGVEAVLRERLGLTAGDTESRIAAQYWPLPELSGGMLELYLSLADQRGGAKAQEVAYGLRLASRERDEARRAEMLEKIFLTAKGEPKSDSQFLVKAMLAEAPQLTSAIAVARAHIVASRDRLKLMRMCGATQAALVLAGRLNHDYEELKKQRSQLDFEDLITRTADLLTKSGVGPWIHYKLDRGIDHILVDEAQDTSPIQWSVIQSLAGDFFSGESARSIVRTLFAVGDEKQSIYSFQGARPERFSEESDRTRRRVSESGQSFSSVRLPLSFRSTADVLEAVDQIFRTSDNARGLSALGEPVVHRSSRIGHPGAVDLWEMIAPEAVVKEEDWTAPFDATPESAPAAILARRIAHAVGTLVGRETIVDKGKERLIEAGDILVLVRKRDAFVNALTRALKRRGDIPVAGADRLTLTSHIAVQDLLALGRFLLLPEDDLSLAAVLKSPLFDFSEDDVFAIAGLRGDNESVWNHLKRFAADGTERFRAAVERLELFLRQSRRLSVHDFYARVLGSHGGRRQFLARLGTEVSDILDEFLTFTLDHESSGLPGLQSFISTLELEAPEVKREQDKGRNEVRIMTVHASKGLEAPIVFLVDGGSKAFTHTHLPKLRLIETDPDEPPLPAWVPVSDLTNSLTQNDAARIQMLAEEEYRRLLYVAMTRAADRLIVCGYRGVRANADTWHMMISTALGEGHPHVETATFSGPDGEWPGIRWRVPRVERSFERIDRDEARDSHEALPEGLLRPLPPQAELPRPLSPSGAGTIVDEDEGSLFVASPLFGGKERSDRSLEKGRLIHRMLQALPEIPPAGRADAAHRYAERAARFWPEGERRRLVDSVLKLLDEGGLQPVLGVEAQPEVSIMGTLTLDDRRYAVSGRIDRLAVLADRVVILDYKTNRVPPVTEEAVPFAHKAQLAIYREILAPLYPGKRIDCMLVYTENASLYTLSETALGLALAGLKTK